MFLWRRRRDPRRARALHGPDDAPRPGRWPARPGWPRPTTSCVPSRSTTRSWRARRRTSGSSWRAMDVGWSDLGSWTALLPAIGAVGDRRVVQASEPAEAGADGPGRASAIGGRLAVSSRPAGYPRHDADRRSCEAPRPGRPRRRGARRPRDPLGGPLVTRRPRHPTTDRLRHRRLAGPDRRRLHVRERPPLRRRRGPLRRRARASGPRASSSPTTGGSRPSTSRSPRPRSSSPTTSRSPSPITPSRPR